MINERITSQSTERLLSLVASTGAWGHKLKLAKLDDNQRQIIEKFDLRISVWNLGLYDVRAAVDTLIEHEISEDLEDILLKDFEGPLMVRFLGLRPDLMATFDGLTEAEATIQLDELRDFASCLKPQTSQVCDPPDTLRGGGVPAYSAANGESSTSEALDDEPAWTIESAIADDVFNRMVDHSYVQDIRSAGGGKIFDFLTYDDSQADLSDRYGLDVQSYWLRNVNPIQDQASAVAKRKYGGLDIVYSRNGSAESFGLRRLVDEFTKIKSASSL